MSGAPYFCGGAYRYIWLRWIRSSAGITGAAAQDFQAIPGKWAFGIVDRRRNLVGNFALMSSASVIGNALRLRSVRL